MNEKEPEIYEIDLSKKYILAFDEFIPDGIWRGIQDEIERWLKDDSRPILMVRGAGNGIKLVKVSDD